jgi:hypothetical protein
MQEMYSISTVPGNVTYERTNLLKVCTIRAKVGNFGVSGKFGDTHFTCRRGQGRMRTISKSLHLHILHQIQPPSLHISYNIRKETRGGTVLHSMQ